MSDISGVVSVDGTTATAGVLAGSLPSFSSASSSTVAANAEAPVWQPWQNVQNNALSAFKTEIGKALVEYNKQLGAAQQYLDTAELAAKTQVQALVTTAQQIYQKYMQEADALYNAVMGPALQAYATAAADAHTKLWERLTPPERAYAQVAADAVWTNGLANGNAKLGPQAPFPGQQ